MGTAWHLVNQTRREYALFLHLPASTKHEIAGCAAAAAVVAWYMLEHGGDRIAFLPDHDSSWPFDSGSRRDLKTYREVTDEVVDALIAEGILAEEARETFDDDEPEVYIRRLRNIWDPACGNHFKNSGPTT